MLSLLDGLSEPRAAYSNSMDFVGNPVEIRLGFFLGSPSGRFKVAEVIMAPMVAKALSRMLPDRIKAWEKDNGFITLPEDIDLLESLFQVKLRPVGDPNEPPDVSN